MRPRLGADTDLINSPALGFAQDEISETVTTYEGAIVKIGQIVRHNRKSELDDYVRQLTKESPEVVRMLLSLIDQVARGDVGATRQLAEFFEKAEAENTKAAGEGTIKH